MMFFGPAGNSDRFYSEGYKSTDQAFKWLRDMGLDAYEFSFGRGVRGSKEGMERMRTQASASGITLSVHAPYYINLANEDPEKREGSFRYILESARAARLLGAAQVVVHIGAVMGMERKQAVRNCRDGITESYRRMDEEGLSDIRLCPETMGKRSQIGDLSETLAFCTMDDRLIPCIDFAHLHALSGGSLMKSENFAAILDETERALGLARARKTHIHFSTIEFTAAGEKCHHTFAEGTYGPRFDLLAPLLAERGYESMIICESKGTQADDALSMRRIMDQYNQ